jgi:hypothetical protein
MADRIVRSLFPELRSTCAAGRQNLKHCENPLSGDDLADLGQWQKGGKPCRQMAVARVTVHMGTFQVNGQVSQMTAGIV